MAPDSPTGTKTATPQMDRLRFNADVAREMCAGVPRANPNHPRLHRDIEGAVFMAEKSATFRAFVVELERAKGGAS